MRRLRRDGAFALVVLLGCAAVRPATGLAEVAACWRRPPPPPAAASRRPRRRLVRLALLLCLRPCSALHIPAARTAAPRAHPIMGNPVRRAGIDGSTAKAYLQSTMVEDTLARRWIQAGGPRWVTLLDEVAFFGASVIFIVGSFDFFPGTPFAQYVEGCELFIIGSAIYLALSLFAIYECVQDASLAGKRPSTSLLAEQALYVVGSGLFLVGTVLFTPPLAEPAQLQAGIGAAAASAEAVSASPVMQVLSVPWFGHTYAVLVQQGGAPPEAAEASLVEGDLLFVAGSVLYSIAAFSSALKAAGESGSDADSALRRRTAVAVASLYELGGVAFVVGTLGFFPAEALGIAACPDGGRTLTTAGATLFVGGSCLYALGSALGLGVNAYLTYSRADGDGAAPGAGGRPPSGGAPGPTPSRLNFGAATGLATIAEPEPDGPDEGAGGGAGESE